MGANHKVNSPKISQDDDGTVLVRAETSFQIDPKCFQKVTMNIKKKIT